MAQYSITCRNVRQIGGKVYIKFSDKGELEFSSLAEARAFVQRLLDDPDLLKRLFLAIYLSRDPNGTNPAIMEGKTLTLEPDAANLLQLLRITT